MYFYQRLKDIREDFDKKQEDIALILHITRQQYQLYESGKREMPMHLFIELARYYDISLDYLAGLTETPKSIKGKPYSINKNITVGDITNSHNINIKN